MKALKVFALVTGIGLAFMIQDVSAREFADIYTECGLGAMIAPRNAAVAAATNVTWDLGTTAISSNITSPDTCQGGKEKTAAFIYKSYSSLERALAQGRGEYLDALLALAGCASAHRVDLIGNLRSSFAAVVEEPEYTERTRYQKAEALYMLFHRVVEERAGYYSCSIS